MELFKRGNATEDKNGTTEMPSMSDDLEVVELGADDSAIQSAKAAVEAMKNSSFFGQQTGSSDGLAPTTPVFTPEQLGAEMPSAAAATGNETIQVSASDSPATSAAEAVARLNAPSAAMAEYIASAAVVEDDPAWKINMDAIDTRVADKVAEISESVKEQLEAVEASVQKKLQELQEVMRSQIQLAEDTVKAAVKEAGSSTEKVVEAEKLKLTSAFDLEKQTMNANFDKKLQELQEKHDAEIRSLKEAHNQEITQIKDDQLNSLDKMKQMYSDQMDEMQTAYREKNAALKREMDQYKEKLDILMLEHEADPFAGGDMVATAEAPSAE